MWWWVALGIVGVELLVLVLLALSVLLRLVDLARAAGRTQQRMRKAHMHTRGPSGFTVMDHEIPQMPEFHMGGVYQINQEGHEVARRVQGKRHCTRRP